MTKRVISYILSGILSLIIVSGCINYTNTGTEQGAPVQEIESKGGKIDGVYFCPQLKSDPDNYRKPSPMMAYYAKNEFPDIDLQKSIMIGDMNSDVEFGKNAGMKTIFVGDNELTLTPDDRFNTLYDFAKTL